MCLWTELSIMSADKGAILNMKKLDNFINCLTILANADFKMAETNDIYRAGVIWQFYVKKAQYLCSYI